MLTRRSFFSRLSALMTGLMFWRPKPVEGFWVNDKWITDRLPPQSLVSQARWPDGTPTWTYPTTKWRSPRIDP